MNVTGFDDPNIGRIVTSTPTQPIIRLDLDTDLTIELKQEQEQDQDQEQEQDIDYEKPIPYVIEVIGNRIKIGWTTRMVQLSNEKVKSIDSTRIAVGENTDVEKMRKRK